MSKILITGGCSFSECITGNVVTWPTQLEKSLPDYKHISTGLGSQGNGLISRKIIYEVSQQLKNGVDPSDILVCIMWSSVSRFDTYFDFSHPEFLKVPQNWMDNPTSFVRENNHKKWQIFNHHWTAIKLNKLYYRELYSDVMATIQTLEHILRVQWFLKTHNISYTMTTYMAHVFEKVNHPECKYLYDMIDKDHFLPVTGEYEWCKEVSMFDFPRKDDDHPGTEQHWEFTQEVILPFLKQKGYIG